MRKENFFLMSQTVSDLLFDNTIPKKSCFYFVDRCPLCKSNETKKLFKQWNIYYHQCKDCDFVYSNPRLTDEGAYIWYNSDYYNAAMSTEHYIAENFNKYYSISLNEYHLNKFFEIFNRFNQSKNISIADVGCGSGAVIHYLKDKLGFKNVVGFDLNASNLKFAARFRKIEIRNVDIFDMDTSQKFDIIITTENIEHVSDPIKYVEQIKKIIKPGGYLFLTTPHNDKLATKLMGLSGDHFCAPNHQNYFNTANLNKLFTTNNFKIDSDWIDDTNRFNSYAFLKRFFINRDQVTGYPPINPSLKTIWKWKKEINDAVILNGYEANNFSLRDNPLVKNNYNLKSFIKNRLKNLIPIKFNTHQILVAKYNG